MFTIIKGSISSFFHTQCILFRSGTVNVEEIDDTTGPVLGERGLIGINLREEDSFTEFDLCEQWVNRQLVPQLGRGRVECSLPCAPTLTIARREVEIHGGFANEQLNFFNDTCLTSESLIASGALICCYSRSDDRLIDHAQLGAGRSLPAEAASNRTIREEEDEAYENCCLSETANTESCDLFSSVRPVCTSSGWQNSRRRRWGKSSLRSCLP